MADTFVKDASEMFKVGDTVSVRVISIDLEKKQVALSRKTEGAEQERAPRERKPKADLTEFETADEKEFITAKINSIQSYGAFATIKEGVDGLIHISQIQDGGVSSVEVNIDTPLYHPTSAKTKKSKKNSGKKRKKHLFSVSSSMSHPHCCHLSK